MTLILRFALLVLVALTPLRAAAQGEPWPSKPVRIVVGFTAGGTTDIIARLVGNKLSEAWGQGVSIDNRPGAGGNLGSAIVAKAPPDGYTLLIGSVGPLAVNASLYKDMPYDALTDFAPIVLIATVQNVLVVPPELPVRSVKDLVELARAKPGELNFASTGSGTSAHLSGELLKQMAKIDMVHVPYRGAVGLNDLLGGRIQLMFATIPSVIAHIRAGSLRAVAVTSSRRSLALPDLPTVEETGYPGFDASSWFGIVAPVGTPRAIVDKIHRDTVRIVNLPDIRENLLSQGADPIGSTPEEFGRFMKSETEKWAEIVRISGARAE
jgi:tripartite-type tricarboxylate transporter receptor subunit TctC